MFLEVAISGSVEVRVKHLLGIFAFRDGVGLMHSLVALQRYLLVTSGPGDGSVKLGLADTRGAFRQKWFAQLLRKEDDRGDSVRWNIFWRVEGAL